jgi:hypothetical protein
MLQAEGRGLIPDEIIGFFNWRNASSRTVALESTKLLTGMSTSNFPGAKRRPAHKADNLIAISKLIIQKIWEPWCFITLWASTACYRGYLFFPFMLKSINTVTCYLRSQPIQRFIARQQLCKHATVLEPLLGSSPCATLEVQLEAVFSMCSAPRLHHCIDR